MPVMLPKTGVRPLLKTVNNLPNQPHNHKLSRGRQAPPDIDPDAEPLSSSDSDISDIGTRESLSNGGVDTDVQIAPDASRTHNLTIQATRSRANPVNASLVETSSSNADFKPQDHLGTRRSDRKISHKRKREAGSTKTGSLEVSDKEDKAFEEMRTRTKKKNRIQYTSRKLNSTTSNMHASPERKHTVHRTKDTRFKKPQGITGSFEDGKGAFRAPIPLQNHCESPNEKSEFKTPQHLHSSPKSSNPVSFRMICSSEPTNESSSVPSSPPASEILEASHELYEHQLATLESLNSPPRSPESISANSDIARCPMCKAEVDANFLESFSKSKKLSLKTAMDFCVAHKQRKVQSDSIQSNYVRIDWQDFGKRLRKFNHKLNAILEQRVPSVYRTELEEKIASGRSRNALRNPEAEGAQSLKGMTGYYGGKGARKMMEHIMAKFAHKIRVLAAKDRLFTEVGVSGFVQAVLVPELVVMLVMEDYGCDSPRARVIVSESADAGNLMNEEEEERVQEKATDHSMNATRTREGTRGRGPESQSCTVIE